ncbi:MAG TPA: lamin tail domain-containing protein [Candidatus Peribacteraceae bacterium]|nr:lamin tail domain-containing protein [Candidatus Peribacteraceae bacterium]
MDEVDDGVGDPFAGSNPSGGPKASMERISLTGSGSDKSNWRTATATRRFDSGVLIYGTPGYANDASDPIEISSTASSVSYEQKSSSEISNQPYKSIKINEVLPNPTGSDTGEWIELFNSGSTALSLSGLTLTVDSASYTLRASALSGAIISSDSYFLLPKESVGFTLKNGGSTVVLQSGSTVLDSVTYPALPEGVSNGRNADGRWIPFCSPTPGQSNAQIPAAASIQIQSGSPQGVDPVTLNLQATATGSALTQCTFDFGDGYVSDSCNPASHTMRSAGVYSIRLTAQDYCGNTMKQDLLVNVQQKPSSSHVLTDAADLLPANERPLDCRPAVFTGVTISEFLPNPSGTEAAGEWIELHNNGLHPAPLCGWSIDDGSGGSKPYSLSHYQIPVHDYLLLPRTKTGIALNNDADMVRLISPRAEGGTGVLLSVAYRSAPEDQSYALTASGAWTWTKNPTPQLPNVFEAPHNRVVPSPVTITAALPNPAGDDTYDEWVELTNSDGIPHWLNGWSLQNQAGKTYSLTGNVLAKVQTKRFALYKTGLQLANGSDMLKLLDADGNVRSLLSWTQATSNQIIQPYHSSGSRVTGRVLYVVDGDTIDVKMDNADKDVRVRLLGIDALEMKDVDSHIAAYALNEKKYLSALLLNKKVELEIDSNKDKYGRTLAYVFLDDQDIDAQMIEEGLAYAYRAFPVGRLQEYIAYERIAREAKMGFWEDDEVAQKVTAKEESETQFANAEQQGLHVSVTPRLMLVSSGTSIHVQSSIKEAPVFVSLNSGSFLPLSGSLIITKNTSARFYASLSLPEQSGSVVRSSVTSQYFVVRQDNYPLSVFLNEVYPSPAKGEQEWIELWNAGDLPVSLAGWQLLVGSGSQKWLMPPLTSIAAHSYLLLSHDLTKLQLRNAGNAIQLINPIGETVDRMTYPSTKVEYSYARNPLGNGYCLTQKPTPEKLNTCFIQNKKSTLKKAQKSGLNTKVVLSKNTKNTLVSGLEAQVMSGSTSMQKVSDPSSVALNAVLSIAICVLGIGGWLLFRKRIS